MTSGTTDLFHALRKAILLAAGVVILLWFLHEVADVVLLSAFALILAVVINAPVTWLERRRVPRWLGSILIFATLVALATLIVWLVVPRLSRELATLIDHVPDYLEKTRDRVSSLLDPYPAVQKNVPLDAGAAGDMMPSLSSVARRLSGLSLSLFTVVAAVLILFAMVIYGVLNPRPLLQLYLSFFPPERREQATRAFSQTSVMLVGWIWSNVVVGTIEAVSVGIVLGLLGVPGALVWAALAFFAELIPKVGIYLMAIPPVLVALAVDPMTALWVAIFYIVMNEVMGNLVTPRIRASAMNIHPVSVLVVMLAMAAAFGVMGALIATPIAAFLKAYFEEFYPNARAKSPQGDAWVEQMVNRELPPRHDQVIIDASH
jgi:predicted PurR-regulated permease PerM